jgi:hypothetical protein
VRSMPELWMAATRSRDLVEREALETHRQRGQEARVLALVVNRDAFSGKSYWPTA